MTDHLAHELNPTINYPTLLAIDASSYEDDAHPIAIAWSLSDGRIKTTLIQPEDDWHDWDQALADIHGIQQDTLYQRGETCWSVLRELENDLTNSEIFVDDIERTSQLLERLYDACDRELTVECQPITFHLDAPHSPCDERVLMMLEQWQD